ncbi:MAG TPA: CPXCG motif-containing cysteine-rich protein [Steroidobacteraceae bacterium]
MKRRKDPQLDLLTRDLGSLDPRSIDRLYGLEPVYEPGRGRSGAGSAPLLPEEFVAVQCPYCGERLETRVDLTTNEAGYIEDCQVCCRPIEFALERDAGGALLAVKVRQMG